MEDQFWKKSTIIIVCIILVLVSCTICCAPPTFGIMPNYSEGSRSGVIVKASRKGIVFKSYEAQLVLNEFAFGGEGSNIFVCSSLDDAVGAQLQKNVGKKVTIHYRQYLIGPIYQSTKTTVLSVE